VPSRGISRKILDGFHGLPFIRSETSVFCFNKRVVLVWDWSSNPITFDFVWALFQSWFELKALGCNKFELVIMTDGLLHSSSAYSMAVSVEEQVLRINNLIIPIAKNFPVISSVVRLNAIEELESLCNKNKIFLFPRHYSRSYRPSVLDYRKVFSYLRFFSKSDLQIPRYNLYVNKSQLLSLFCASKKSSDITLDRFLEEVQYITLTLRNYGWSPERNTMQGDIDKAMSLAKHLRVSLLVIPDDFSNIRNYFFPPDCFILRGTPTLNSRLTLYSRSIVNIFNPSGPFSSSIFTPNTKSICVNWGAGGWDASERFYNLHYGISRGDQPFLPLNGFVLWTGERGNYRCADLFDALERLS
jgi:hypothetical protein